MPFCSILLPNCNYFVTFCHFSGNFWKIVKNLSICNHFVTICNHFVTFWLDMSNSWRAHHHNNPIWPSFEDKSRPVFTSTGAYGELFYSKVDFFKKICYNLKKKEFFFALDKNKKICYNLKKRLFWERRFFFRKLDF